MGIGLAAALTLLHNLLHRDKLQGPQVTVGGANAPISGAPPAESEASGARAPVKADAKTLSLLKRFVGLRSSSNLHNESDVSLPSSPTCRTAQQDILFSPRLPDSS